MPSGVFLYDNLISVGCIGDIKKQRNDVFKLLPSWATEFEKELFSPPQNALLGISEKNYLFIYVKFFYCMKLMIKNVLNSQPGKLWLMIQF